MLSFIYEYLSKCLFTPIGDTWGFPVFQQRRPSRHEQQCHWSHWNPPRSVRWGSFDSRYPIQRRDRLLLRPNNGSHVLMKNKQIWEGEGGREGMNSPASPLVMVMSVMGPWLLCRIERGEVVLRRMSQWIIKPSSAPASIECWLTNKQVFSALDPRRWKISFLLRMSKPCSIPSSLATNSSLPSVPTSFASE